MAAASALGARCLFVALATVVLAAGEITHRHIRATGALNHQHVLAASAPKNASGLPPALKAVFLESTDPEKLDYKDYRNPNVWGPPTWFFLHSMTMALPHEVPAEQQQSIQRLMQDLQKVLPCPTCGVHLEEHMKQHPLEPHLGSRDALIQWMIDIHNMVNKACGKREWTREEVMAEYNEAYKEGSKEQYLAVIGKKSGTVRAARESFLPLTVASVLLALGIA
eukprot:gnl/TRDRNA2_/TRDRNA2_187861_c0_seq1.p1 gnl/TRDRNA2_/TRDRNA2_187861_c0~~gnl/TRDRNA2_/TRDRNA2_187861_c0_seq1.p1  ORF type:complete len:223 (-),score=47.19 gnl/TRDRNA2_/TRDRNA2_187861_c0_seq1:62-730(-)